MQDIIFGVLLVVAFTFGMIVGNEIVKQAREVGNEQITEQQYRNQSLQYLEDIRNSTQVCSLLVN